MQTWLLALIGALTSAAAPGNGPSAAPSTGSSSLYGNPRIKIAIQWRNGDASAYTRIYLLGALVTTVAPGETYYSTGKYTSGAPYTWTLRHYKNGQESAGLEVGYPDV